MHNKNYVLTAEIRDKFDRKKMCQSDPNSVMGTESKSPNPNIFL